MLYKYVYSRGKIRIYKVGLNHECPGQWRVYVAACDFRGYEVDEPIETKLCATFFDALNTLMEFYKSYRKGVK